MSHQKQNKVTAEWDAMAGEWDDMASSYRDGFVNLLWNEIPYYKTKESRKDLTIVDFGCGTGLLSEVIRHDVKHVIAIDVAPTMIQILKDKIRSGDWKNVDAYCGVLSETETDSNPNNNNNDDLKTIIKSLEGKVDIIAASSVLSFIPEEDIEITIKILAKMLKSKTGVLCHTDWPKNEEKHPDGFDEIKANNMYKKAGDGDDGGELLQPKTTKITSLKMGKEETPVFVGVAIKN